MKTLIIDDDKISLFLTRQTLAEAGYTGDTLSFLSSEEALSALLQDLAADIPRLILLDLNMPRMDGWEFLEALRPYTQQLLGRCRIYILTSSLDLSDTARSEEELLVCGVIHKPMAPSDIQVILSQLGIKVG